MRTMLIALATLATALTAAGTAQAAYQPPQSEARASLTTFVNKRMAFYHRTARVTYTRCLTEVPGLEWYCELRVGTRTHPRMATIEYIVTYNAGKNFYWFDPQYG